jgi:hypothetical protein
MFRAVTRYVVPAMSVAGGVKVMSTDVSGGGCGGFGGGGPIGVFGRAALGRCPGSGTAEGAARTRAGAVSRLTGGGAAGRPTESRRAVESRRAKESRRAALSLAALAPITRAMGISVESGRCTRKSSGASDRAGSRARSKVTRNVTLSSRAMAVTRGGMVSRVMASRGIAGRLVVINTVVLSQASPGSRTRLLLRSMKPNSV